MSDEPHGFYTVTVVEGERPECLEHTTLSELVTYLKGVIDSVGTAVYVFAGRRLLFSDGRIPQLLLDTGNISLVDDEVKPNLSGIIGDDSEPPTEGDDEPREPVEPFPDSAGDLPEGEDEEADDGILDSWQDDDDD